jgi:hypothetical protein
MSRSKKSSRKPAKKVLAKKGAAARPRPAAKKAAPAKEREAAKKKPAPPAPALARKPAPAAAPPPAKPRPEAAPPAREARKPPKPRPKPPILPDLVKPGLGGRWECFRCQSKFYDLGKPEPICPKCGADQRDKPRERPSAPPTPPPADRIRRPSPPIGGLLDEDEEPIEEFEGDEDELAAIDEDAFLTETPAPTDEEDEDVDVTVLDEE